MRPIICLILAAGCLQADSLDNAVRRSLAARNVPAASIAVVRNGEIRIVRGYGDNVDAETLFQAASISKSVTAMAVVRMAQEGRLGLDQPVNELLQRWKLPENEFTVARKVTVRDLLSHTAGVTVSGFPGYPVGSPLPSLVEILDGKAPANTPAIRVDVAPGSTYRYSGGGYTVLRLMLEDISGQTFNELMQKTVLEPLGMTHSTFLQPLPPDLAKRGAPAIDGQGRTVPGGWNVYPELAPDGLWTTPTDLAKFAIELWRALRGASRRVLDQKSAKEMMTVRLEHYALGLQVNGEGRGVRFRHDGGNRGYRCRLVFFPEIGDGVAIMTNGGKGDEVIPDVMKELRAEFKWPE
jgi:CubicO group peptidase (beta-lactamase class C family)